MVMSTLKVFDLLGTNGVDLIMNARLGRAVPGTLRRMPSRAAPCFPF
jgi:hypothetical protein